MSENIIYCYSGSGNCLNMARYIAKNLGDTDIVMMRGKPVITDAREYKRVGFIFPCYAGGLPGDVEKHVRQIVIGPNAYKFGIVQYAGYMGSGLHKIDEIVGLNYWAGVAQHCSAIWLMPHNLCLAPQSIEKSQSKSAAFAQKVAEEVKIYKYTAKPPKMEVFGLMNGRLPDVNKKLNAKMTVSDACVSCGTCVAVCPKGNIELHHGMPVIGTDCIGCMSCVQYCPKEAINVGKLTQKRERYHNPNVSAADLAEAFIHID